MLGIDTGAQTRRHFDRERKQRGEQSTPVENKNKHEKEIKNEGREGKTRTSQRSVIERTRVRPVSEWGDEASDS